MNSPLITLERSNSYLIIRLNRPENLNALSRKMIIALREVFTNLADQPNLRAVILTSAGDKAFSFGKDVTVFDDVEAREVSERAEALFNQIERCGVPVIAAVNGIAAGLGLDLALACHLRIASVNAEFRMRAPNSDTIAQRLIDEIGHGRSLEMLLTRKAVSAEEALRFGLVNRVTAHAELLAQAKALAHEIAQLAPLAIRACLEAVTRGTQLPLAEGLALEGRLFANLFDTDDVREGTSAFFEKRAPVFKGT